MPFKTQFNHVNTLPDGEINKGKHLTQPDQTMSIREIYARVQSGRPIDGQKVPVWDSEDEAFPDMTGWDLVEKDEYFNAVREELEATQKKVDAQKAELERRRKEKALFEQKKKWAEEYVKNKPNPEEEAPKA